MTDTTAVAVEVDRIAGHILLAQPYQYVTEDDLQHELATALAAAGIAATREVRLSDGASRIDFLVGHVGIEVKIKGTWVDVTRQLRRYSKCTEIHALILVTSRASHEKVLRSEVDGIPVRVVSLLGGGL